MKFENILILGGSGELGTNLVSFLRNKYNIIIFDKKYPKVKYNNVKFIKGNLLNIKTLRKIPKNISAAIFLVGHIGGSRSLEEKFLNNYIKFNCDTLVNFLSNVSLKLFKKIIFMSTEHVYGDHKINCNLESHPKNYYGVSKLISEKICYNFFKKTRISVDIIRFPRVIIPNNSSIISNMIKQAKINSKITINKNKIFFNFLYIDDFIKSIQLCLNYKKKKFRIINIFNHSKPITLYQLANKVKKMFKKAVRIKNKKMSFIYDHNPKFVNFDKNETQKILNWKPIYAIDEIIKKIFYYETK
jgi:nucleoside-diphosphate-sugar epimerase